MKISKQTKKWLKAAGSRAVRTVCQTAVAMLPAAGAIADVDWWIVVSTALLAGLVSILTSVAKGMPEVKT